MSIKPTYIVKVPDDLDFQTYKKKPIIIRAALLTREIDIETLEGTMHGNVGDYLIIGVKGELYPCKPDIFLASYNKT
jgi:hypothetical protein